MTSRERVISSLNHIEVDKTPIDLGAFGSTGINISAYMKLKKTLGLNTKRLDRISSIWQQLAAIEPEIVDCFNIDVIDIMNPFYWHKDNSNMWKEYVNRDGSNVEVPNDFCPKVRENGDICIEKNNVVLQVMAKNAKYFESVHTHYANVETISDLSKVSFSLYTNDELDEIENQAKYLYENTDKALFYFVRGTCGYFTANLNAFGYENFLVKMALEPKFVKTINQLRLENTLMRLEQVIERIEKYVQVVAFADDLGTQRSPMISSDMFVKLIKPYYMKTFRYIKDKYPHLKIFLHSCGSVEKLIPDLIDCGLDILNPVQISASGMNPVYLKKHTVKILAFGEEE